MSTESQDLQRTSHPDAHETAVGITVYVRPETSRFQCVVKQRYTDFLVNEVLPNGSVLHLTEIPLEKSKKRKRAANGEETVRKENNDSKRQRSEGDGALEEDKNHRPVGHPEQTFEAAPQKPDASTSASINAVKENAIASISNTDKAVVVAVFGQHTTTDILNLYASVLAFPDRKARDHNNIKSEPIAEKSQRTEAHVCIRRIFGGKLETVTIQDQDNQSGPGTIINIRAAPPKSANDQATGAHKEEGQRGRQNWADLGGEYLHFTLHKENKDTMEVLYFLASQLKLHVKHFSFAGTKDRRAVTVQRVAIFRVRQERIEGLNKLSKGWILGGPWEYKQEPLDLGMLQGNEFVLTLRNAVFQGETPDCNLAQRLQHCRRLVNDAAQCLNESGFINYYGLQRFGTHNIGTHVVGTKMLKGDLKGAVDAILAYEPSLVAENGDVEDLQNADSRKKIPQDEIARATAIHKFVTSGSSSEALPLLPGNRFQAEKGLITYLGKKDRKTGRRANENDYQGALMQIQRNLRLMYVHAYQSFIWNSVAGKRWQDSGNTVIEGDLVVVGEKEKEEGITASTAAVDEVDEDGEPIIHPAAAESSDLPAIGNAQDDPFVRARSLTREEAASGRFTIFDIVLPLPGYDVEYPKNKIGKFYEELMASEAGGQLDPYSMRRGWKDISLSGGYRKMMARPLGDGVHVEVRPYSDPDEQLVATDLEQLRNKTLDGGIAAVAEDPDGSLKPGLETKLAIVARLQLGSSQYATMALRELTKGGAIAYTPDYSVASR